MRAVRKENKFYKSALEHIRYRGSETACKFLQGLTINTAPVQNFRFVTIFEVPIPIKMNDVIFCNVAQWTT
jgi:hypothetical protein